MWIAPNGEQLTNNSNDRITIVDMLQSAPYTSVLMFDPADDMDTGDYQCNVTVEQNINQPLILPSINNATSNINIMGELKCIDVTSFRLLHYFVLHNVCAYCVLLMQLFLLPL